MTKNRWAAPPVGKDVLATLHQVEASFPVSLIATDRNDFVCCSPGEDALVTATVHLAADFDHLPVVSDGVIIGLFSRKLNYSGERVKEVMVPLTERIIMSSKGSMLEFLENADHRPFVFLVHGNQISGAVTLSDIQKVAARPPIFLRLTLFEILVSNWIRRNANDTWLNYLEENDRKKITRTYEQRVESGEEIDLIAVADLRPKLKAAFELKAFGQWSGDNAILVQLNKFRNLIAHAHEYGADPASATVVPQYLRKLREFITLLEPHAS